MNGAKHTIATDLSDLIDDVTFTAFGSMSGTNLELSMNVNGIDQNLVIDMSDLLDHIPTPSPTLDTPSPSPPPSLSLSSMPSSSSPLSKSIVAIQATGNKIGGSQRRQLKGKSAKHDGMNKFYFGYEDEIVGGFVVIREGSIVGLSGLLANVIEGDDSASFLRIDIMVNDSLVYDGITFVGEGLGGSRSVVTEFESGSIPVFPGDIVTFVVKYEKEVLSFENSVNLVLLLEQ